MQSYKVCWWKYWARCPRCCTSKMTLPGPEVARLLDEFKIFHTVDEQGVLKHLDSSRSVAKQFLSDVKIFLGVVINRLI